MGGLVRMKDCPTKRVARALIASCHGIGQRRTFSEQRGGLAEPSASIATKGATRRFSQNETGQELETQIQKLFLRHCRET